MPRRFIVIDDDPFTTTVQGSVHSLGAILLRLRPVILEWTTNATHVLAHRLPPLARVCLLLSCVLLVVRYVLISIHARRMYLVHLKLE